MPTLQIRQARPEDAYGLQIRRADVAEIHAYGLPGRPQDILHACVEGSTASFLVRDLEGPLALFGHSVSPDGISPWLICGDRAKDYPRILLRVARRYLKSLRSLGPVWNTTPTKGPRERAFLERLGFDVQETRPGWDTLTLKEITK